MPNSKLQGKSYEVPLKVRNCIEKALARINAESEQAKGYKRANDLLEKSHVSYSQMKRLKNYFDNYEGDGRDDEFNLVGGKITREWVDDCLKNDRESIKKVKTIKKDAGLENQFLKTHTKDRDNKNVGKANGGMIDIEKSSTSDRILSGDAIYKENYNKQIKDIQYLIEYLSKN